MLCLLVMTMMVLARGIVAAEGAPARRGGHKGQGELDDSTRAWLLMVEAGQVDDEKLRRITPKSVFIAPMLASRAERCQDGYRRDHLGNCVKIIKINPNFQLELLLKRLSAMYAEVKDEQKPAVAPGTSEASSGPLQFSIPILNPEATTKVDKPSNNFTSVLPEVLPVPLAMMNNKTTKSDVPEAGSGEGSGDVLLESATENVSLISNDEEFTELLETTTESAPESSGDDALSTTETQENGTEGTTTELPSYQDVTEPEPVINLTEEVTKLTKVQNSSEDIPTGEGLDRVTNVNIAEVERRQEKQSEESQKAVETLPSKLDEGKSHPLTQSKSETRPVTQHGGETSPVAQINSETRPVIQHGGDTRPVTQSKSETRPLTHQPFTNQGVETQPLTKQGSQTHHGVDTHLSTNPAATPQLPQGEVSHHPASAPSWKPPAQQSLSLPREEFWWVPPNWHVDEDQQKPTLVKFWSRFPLIRDASFVEPGVRFPQDHVDHASHYREQTPVHSSVPFAAGPEQASTYATVRAPSVHFHPPDEQAVHFQETDGQEAEQLRPPSGQEAAQFRPTQVKHNPVQFPSSLDHRSYPEAQEPEHHRPTHLHHSPSVQFPSSSEHKFPNTEEGFAQFHPRVSESESSPLNFRPSPPHAEQFKPSVPVPEVLDGLTPPSPSPATFARRGRVLNRYEHRFEQQYPSRNRR